MRANPKSCKRPGEIRHHAFSLTARPDTQPPNNIRLIWLVFYGLCPVADYPVFCLLKVFTDWPSESFPNLFPD